MSKEAKKKEDASVELPEKEAVEKEDGSKAALEEKKPVKMDKPAPEKKHKEERGARGLYAVEGEKVKRLRPTCERCGIGYFMADHHDRYTCGHCGFTRYKQTVS